MMLGRDVTDGLKQGVLLGAAVLVLLVPQVRYPGRPVASGSPAAEVSGTGLPGEAAAPAQAVATARSLAAAEPALPPLQRRLDFGSVRPSQDVWRVARWVVDTADNGRRHFVILDKRNARLYVFEPGGKLAGASPVLLGYAAGDHTVPGIGERPIDDVKPSERTTPAGRFLAERGRNARQEDVVWVDYDAAVSMHRVLTTNPAERRLQRLASPTSRDNRISYGCINLPPRFFERVLFPRFQRQAGIVYVLPEVKPLAAVFPGAGARTAATRRLSPA